MGQGVNVWLTVYLEWCKALWDASLALRKAKTCSFLVSFEGKTKMVDDQFFEGERSGHCCGWSSTMCFTGQNTCPVQGVFAVDQHGADEQRWR